MKHASIKNLKTRNAETKETRTNRSNIVNTLKRNNKKVARGNELCPDRYQWNSNMKTKTAKIDLHGMLRLDAECALRNFLDNLPNNVHTVEVIHGVGSGILKQMVFEFYHFKIQDRVQCIGNAGQTNYYIV